MGRSLISPHTPASRTQRINAYLHERGEPPYVINLDPAVTHVPYTPNIDIRDTVNFKEVMKQCVGTLGR